MAYAPNLPYFAHQKNALRHLGAWRQPYFFWPMDMGTGKSKVAIDNAAILYEQGKISGLFVVAPKSVCRVWSDEQIPAHFPARHARSVLLYRPKSDRGAGWGREWSRLLDSETFAILVMNVEALAFPSGVEMAEEFLRSRPCMMVVDESHTIKNHQAKRTKGALHLGKLAAYRRALTGTPVTRAPLDLWGQCQFLQPGVLGDTSFWSFRSRYAILRERNLGGRSFVEVIGYRDLDKLQEILAGFSFTVKKSDCLDLPEKIYTRREVELTAEQRKAYDQLRKQFKAEMEDGLVCTATNVLARMVRMQQVLAGYLKMDDGSTKELASNRLSVLAEVLSETQGSALIFSPWRHDIAQISAMIRKTYGEDSLVEIHGDVKEKDRAQNVERFQKKDGVRFLVATPTAGGVGLTLTAATTVVYYANTWDLMIRAQSEDRAHRAGQGLPVTYVDLVAPGTVDEHVLAMLKSKKALADLVAGKTPKEILAWV